MYNYYDLIAICEEISTKLDSLQGSIDMYLPKILVVIAFGVFLKVGFTCMKGIKV